MRIVTILLIFCQPIFSACLNNEETTKIGKWYSPYFGLVEILDDKMIFYPNHLEEEVWKFDYSKNAYLYNGTVYSHCIQQENQNLLAIVNEKEKDQIIINSSNTCFLKHPFGNSITLNRIPENIQLEFEKISFTTRRKNSWKEVIYTLDEFESINNENSFLSIKQQVWVLFNSGLNYNSSHLSENYNDKIYVSIIGKNLHQVKEVNAIATTKYLRPLFNKVIIDLE